MLIIIIFVVVLGIVDEERNNPYDRLEIDQSLELTAHTSVHTHAKFQMLKTFEIG